MPLFPPHKLDESRVTEASNYTMKDLRGIQVSRLHEDRKFKSITWAVEDKAIDIETDPTLHAKSIQFRDAIEDLAFPKVGRSTERSKAPSTESVTVFKELCRKMGIGFKEDNIKDLMSLLAAIQARLSDPSG